MVEQVWYVNFIDLLQQFRRLNVIAGQNMAMQHILGCYMENIKDILLNMIFPPPE